jgi:hypothetical protein
MADHLSSLERDGASMDAFIWPPEIPVIVISSADQPPEEIAAHRTLAGRSIGGRHITAARSGHWVQFDEPALIVSVVRDLVESQRSGEDESTPAPTRNWPRAPGHA